MVNVVNDERGVFVLVLSSNMTFLFVLEAELLLIKQTQITRQTENIDLLLWIMSGSKLC